MPQQSIYIDGLGHGGTPIPLACRVGDLLVTSGVGGRDPVTGAMGDTVEEQLEGCFANLVAILAQAGMSLDNVAKLAIATRDEGDRDAINRVWIRYFPDPAQRPARHVQVASLRGAVLVQLEATAYAD